jgi:hypothetical protein
MVNYTTGEVEELTTQTADGKVNYTSGEVESLEE